MARASKSSARSVDYWPSEQAHLRSSPAVPKRRGPEDPTPNPTFIQFFSDAVASRSEKPRTAPSSFRWRETVPEDIVSRGTAIPFKSRPSTTATPDLGEKTSNPDSWHAALASSPTPSNRSSSTSKSDEPPRSKVYIENPLHEKKRKEPHRIRTVICSVIKFRYRKSKNRGVGDLQTIEMSEKEIPPRQRKRRWILERKRWGASMARKGLWAFLTC